MKNCISMFLVLGFLSCNSGKPVEEKSPSGVDEKMTDNNATMYYVGDIITH